MTRNIQKQTLAISKYFPFFETNARVMEITAKRADTYAINEKVELIFLRNSNNNSMFFMFLNLISTR